MDEGFLEQIIRQSADETRNHIDIVAERLDHKIQIVAEGVLGNTERMERMDLRFDGIDRRFDGIDQRLDRTDARLDGIDQRLDGMGQRFDGIDQRFDGMDQRFDGLESELHRESDEIRSMIRLSYSELDRRLRTLEDAVTQIQTRMDRVESRIL